MVTSNTQRRIFFRNDGNLVFAKYSKEQRLQFAQRGRGLSRKDSKRLRITAGAQRRSGDLRQILATQPMKDPVRRSEVEGY